MKKPSMQSTAGARPTIAACLLALVTGWVAATSTQGDTFSVVRPERIMPLGDSITRGSGASWGEGYRLQLMRQMVIGRYSSDLVGSQRSGPPWLYDRQHAGYGGYFIDDIMGLVVGELTTYQPDYVLLMIGSNDVQWDWHLDTAPDRLSALIERITDTAPAAHVAVASITLLADPVQDARARVYNAAIPGIVSEKVAAGKRVSFVDMYPLLTTADLVDGVHPNDSGYAKLTAAWAQQLTMLRAAPPAASSRSCPCTIWGTSNAPANLQVTTTQSAEVGVKFRPEKDGFITAIRFYKGPDNAGPHTASLWKAISGPPYTGVETTMSGTLLANGTVNIGASSGWQEVVFSTPVPVQAHALYFASYYAPFGRYAADPGYFRDREIVHSPLRLPAQGAIDGNGFIRVGSPGLPGPAPQADTNYWVDVVFVPVSPDAPSGITATARSASQIDVAWSGVAGATGYRVERSTDATTWTAAVTTGAGVTGYSDTGLQAATTYYYRVRSISNGVESSSSVVTSATTEPLPVLPPAAPSSVTATAVSSSQINVAWTAASRASGYRVERSSTGTTWAAATVTAADVTTFSDTALQPATTYYYRIVATNAGGDSPPSAVASATTQPPGDTTPPTAPDRLKATTAKGKVNLSWVGATDPGGSGVTGYRIWRSTSGASGSFAAIGTTSSTSYSDTNVTAKVDYWYRVTAVDGAGNQSQPSNVVQARPK